MLLSVLLFVAITGGAVIGAELVRGTCRRMLSAAPRQAVAAPRPAGPRSPSGLADA